jgi:hypothetical protein
LATGGGSISGGGGAMGSRRGGGGGSAAAARQTHIAWFEAELKTPAAITGADGAEKETEADALRRMLGMSEWDPKPVLLYFHSEHEEKGVGKPWADQCKQIDDENVARWSGLYHFVEIDRDKSEAKLLERFGAGAGPSFAIVNQDLEVKATSAEVGSPKKFATFLHSTVKKQFSEYWGEIQTRLDEQKAALQEAKSLAKKKDVTGALMRVREVTRSSLRIGSFFDDAVKMDTKLTKKLTNGG